jgi:hypothetical protein
MKIIIEDLPNGQVIKDISINISFEDGQIKNIKTCADNKITEKVINTEPKLPESGNTIVKTQIAPLDTTDVSIEALNTTSDLIPEIDLSKREHKIDTAMMDESF